QLPYDRLVAVPLSLRFAGSLRATTTATTRARAATAAVPSATPATAATAAGTGDLILLTKLRDLRHVEFRLEAKCHVRDAQPAIGFGDRNGDVRRHAGEEFGIGIIEVHYRVIGGHVLHGRRVHTHLRDHAAERLFGKCIDLEGDLLAGAYASHVGFIGLRV